MNVALRPATPEDEPFLYELITLTIADQLAAWVWPDNVRQALLDMQYRARQQGYRSQYPDAEHSIVLVDGQPAGRLVVARLEDQVRLVDIAIAASQRGAGVGARLLTDLITEAETAGRPLRLSVTPTNPAARLYRRLGFVRIDGDEVVEEMEYKKAAPE
jgi:ribosomal protein S18 acetylase RimI-like enzyme